MTKKTKQINKLERILIVNDDAEDILAMQARLPKVIKIEGVSQQQARMLESTSGYDLIIIDNDANNLQESKGRESVQVIRAKNESVPIVYTSFQPGWVDQSVYGTNGVQVVKTDKVIERLGREFGIKVLKQKPIAKKQEPKLNIILTYNAVDGYNAGLYSDKLLIVSYDKMARERAREVLSESLQGIYKKFDWKNDRDLIRNIFVYDGVNGRDMPGFSAASLGHDIRMKVNVLACSCDWDRKVGFKNGHYTDLYRVGCGGREDLGLIADVILGVQRPKIDYAKELPMPLDKILTRTKRFEI